MVLDCHKKDTGKYYGSVYGRMDWKVAPTITTQFFNYGTGRFSHPNQDRAISLREGALIQGFRRCYAFTKDGEETKFSAVGKLIRNAVPPPIGGAVGEVFLRAAKLATSV